MFSWRSAAPAESQAAVATDGSGADPLHIVVPPEAVAALQSAVAEELDSPAGREMVAALGGDPHAFERFLCAAGLDIDIAVERLRATLGFRRDELSKLLPIDADLRAKVRPHWPGAFVGRSSDGKPIKLVKFEKVAPRAMMELVSEEEFRTYYIHMMELSLKHQAACGNSKQVEIYDLSGLSLSQLYVPAIRMFARVLGVGQAHYMESLHRCVVVNAPYAFSYAWSIVSMVLSERSRAKTIILSDDGVETLTAICGFERARVAELLATDVYGEDKEGLSLLAASSSSAPAEEIS